LSPSETRSIGLGTNGNIYTYKCKVCVQHFVEGNHVSKEKLAQQASHIEMVLCGKPIGYQDQYAAAYGGLNELKFTTDNGHNIKVVPLIKNQDDLNSISQWNLQNLLQYQILNQTLFELLSFELRTL